MCNRINSILYKYILFFEGIFINEMCKCMLVMLKIWYFGVFIDKCYVLHDFFWIYIIDISFCLHLTMLENLKLLHKYFEPF